MNRAFLYLTAPHSMHISPIQQWRLVISFLFHFQDLVFCWFSYKDDEWKEASYSRSGLLKLDRAAEINWQTNRYRFLHHAMLYQFQYGKRMVRANHRDFCCFVFKWFPFIVQKNIMIARGGLQSRKWFGESENRCFVSLSSNVRKKNLVT